MKVRTLLGLSILLTSQMSFAQTCKEELERICSTCRYDDICEAVDNERYDWAQEDEMRQCVTETIRSMSPEYFLIQKIIEDKNNPPPINNNFNNDYYPDVFDNGKKDSGKKDSGKKADGKVDGKGQKRIALPGDRVDIVYDKNNGFSDGSDGHYPIIRGGNQMASQDQQGTGSGGGTGTGRGNWDQGDQQGGNYQYQETYTPPQKYRAQGFADKIVRDCQKEIRNKDRSRTKVKVVGETNFHSSTGYTDAPNTLFGGLSGLTVIKGKDGKESKDLLAVSDDKSNPTLAYVKWYEDPVMDPTKPFKFKITKRSELEKSYTEYTRQEAVYSKKDPKAPPTYKTVKDRWPMDIDREDIVILPNGNLLVSSETGDIKTFDGSPAKPNLFQEFKITGELVRGYPSPSDFLTEYKSERKSYDCTPPPPPPPARDSGKGSGSGSGSGSGYSPSGSGFGNPPTPTFGNTFGVLSLDNDREPCGDKRDKDRSEKREKKTCYWTDTKRVAGLEFNKGIEAMTIIPGTDEVLFANESPLTQDREDHFWSKDEHYIRIYSVKMEAWDKKAPTKYFKYKMDLYNDNGVPAILAMDSSRVLVLERGFDSVEREAVVRLYKVELANADKDGVLQKELIVDFKDLKPQFAAGFKKVDNFEGMALGPVRNGNQVIFLVSDNNFSSSQRTTFLALAIPQGALK